MSGEADRLPARVIAYVLILALVAVVTTAVSLSTYGLAAPSGWEPSTAAFTVILIVVIAMLQLAALPTRLLGAGRHHLSTEEIGVAATLVLLPGALPVVVIGIATVAVELSARRSSVKFVFNVSHRMICAAAALGATVWLHPELGAFAAVIGTVTFGVASQLFIAATSLLLNPRWRSALRPGDLADGVVTGLLAGALGVALAVTIMEVQWLAPLALVLVWATHRWWADRARALTERERFARTLRSTSDGIALLDREGAVLVWNEALAELTGLVEAEVEGRHITGIMAELGVVAGSPVEWTSGQEVTLIGPRSDRTVLVESNPVTGIDGAPSGAVLVLRDLTERRRLQEVREDLVMRVSHELRTPLTTTKGFLVTVLAKWDLLEDGRRRHLVSRAFGGAERLDGLINSLLWRARIEANELDPRPRTIELAGFLQQEVPVSAVPHAEVVVGPGTEVHADPTHLATVLELLLENAARYGEEPVSVRASAGSDGTVLLAIEDDGPGVPEDFVGELFAPFAQASTGTRRIAQGLGVGLSIAHALVQCNGGRLDYEPGERGARFVIRLAPARSTQGPQDHGQTLRPHRSPTPPAGASTTTSSPS